MRLLEVMVVPEEKYFSTIIDDFTVTRTLLLNQVKITPHVLEGMARWFKDVELELPLPVMMAEGQERDTLAMQIVDDILATLDRIEVSVTEYGVEKYDAEIDHPKDVCPELVEALDRLWRELAGCYAEQLNARIPSLGMSPEEENQMYAQFISQMSHDLDITEDEAREVVRTNSSFRLMLRYQGINPDRIV
jgi:hypothetical protein